MRLTIISGVTLLSLLLTTGLCSIHLSSEVNEGMTTQKPDDSFNVTPNSIDTTTVLEELPVELTSTNAPSTEAPTTVAATTVAAETTTSRLHKTTFSDAISTTQPTVSEEVEDESQETGRALKESAMSSPVNMDTMAPSQVIVDDSSADVSKMDDAVSEEQPEVSPKEQVQAQPIPNKQPAKEVDASLEASASTVSLEYAEATQSSAETETEDSTSQQESIEGIVENLNKSDQTTSRTMAISDTQNLGENADNRSPPAKENKDIDLEKALDSNDEDLTKSQEVNVEKDTSIKDSNGDSNRQDHSVTERQEPMRDVRVGREAESPRIEKDEKKLTNISKEESEDRKEESNDDELKGDREQGRHKMSLSNHEDLEYDKQATEQVESVTSKIYEQLPTMMALKAVPIVEFSYKAIAGPDIGRASPPSKMLLDNTEPAKPVGEITEQDQVQLKMPSSHAEEDEPRQPDGVLEVARIVTKMLEENLAVGAQHKAEHASSNKLSNSKSNDKKFSSLPTVLDRDIDMPAAASRPAVVTAIPSSLAQQDAGNLDYDYPDVELLRLPSTSTDQHAHSSAHDIKSEDDLEESPSSDDITRTQVRTSSGTTRSIVRINQSSASSKQRTSKIINAQPLDSKDKVVFVKSVPKGSLRPESTTTQSSIDSDYYGEDSVENSTVLIDESQVVQNSKDEEKTESSTDLNFQPEEVEKDQHKPDESFSPEADDEQDSGEVDRKEASSDDVEEAKKEDERKESTEHRADPEDKPVMAPVVQEPQDANHNSLIRKGLKPLSGIDLIVGKGNEKPFIPLNNGRLPEPVVSIPTETLKPAETPIESVEYESDISNTQKNGSEGIEIVKEMQIPAEAAGADTVIRHEMNKYSKPYPMLPRATTPVPVVNREESVKKTENSSSDDNVKENEKSSTNIKYDEGKGLSDWLGSSEPSKDKHRGSADEIEEYKLTCPSKDEIHPCTCQVHTDQRDRKETAVFCKNIRHERVLIEALRGFRGHRISYLVFDSCSLPPFPNNILNRIQVDWMEVINTNVQFKRDYLQCSIKCHLK